MANSALRPVSVDGIRRQARQTKRSGPGAVIIDGYWYPAGHATPGGAGDVLVDHVANLRPEAQRLVVDRYRQARRPDNRVAVVTTIVGGYDPLILPHRPLPGADYICFSDQPQHDWGFFEIRAVDYCDADRVRTARFVKTHLPAYLGMYDIAVWIDASVLVACDLAPYVEAFVRSGRPFGSVFHPERRSVYVGSRCLQAVRPRRSSRRSINRWRAIAKRVSTARTSSRPAFHGQSS